LEDKLAAQNGHVRVAKRVAECNEADVVVTPGIVGRPEKLGLNDDRASRQSADVVSLLTGLAQIHALHLVAHNAGVEIGDPDLQIAIHKSVIQAPN